MLRSNLDRLRDESRDERERRDARNYYFTGDDASQMRGAPENTIYEQAPPPRVERYESDFRQSLPNERNQPQPPQNFARDENQMRERQMQNRMRGDEPNYTRDTARHWADNDNPNQSNPYFPASDRVRENERNESPPSNPVFGNNSPQPQARIQPQNNQPPVAREPENYGQTYFQRRAEIAPQRNSGNQRNANDLLARDVMSRNVATVSPHDSVQHAARLMRDCDCGAIPVVDRNGGMIGMITDRDITVRLVAGGADSRQAKTQDCMTSRVFACHENERFDDFVKAMSEHQIRRMVVLDDQKRVVGIISQGDLARHAGSNRSQHDEFTNLLNEISEPSRNPYR